MSHPLLEKHRATLEGALHAIATRGYWSAYWYLTGGVFVNRSAAYSDYHGTGGNPAANASYTDSAFVANRFRVVQRRYHV